MNTKKSIVVFRGRQNARINEALRRFMNSHKLDSELRRALIWDDDQPPKVYLKFSSLIDTASECEVWRMNHTQIKLLLLVISFMTGSDCGEYDVDNDTVLCNYTVTSLQRFIDNNVKP
jgi:hypothetical protein